ncbi:MAG: hypothetical protein WBJ56_06075 [Dethiobacteria bacterium]
MKGQRTVESQLVFPCPLLFVALLLETTSAEVKNCEQIANRTLTVGFAPL